MTAVVDDIRVEREDRLLKNAFAEATGGAITSPNTLQQALFPRLTSQDTGLLVPTGPGAGRFEAVFVPALTGAGSSESKERLFVVGPDSGVLDDYLLRGVRYLRSLAKADGQPRTAYFEESGVKPVCLRYSPDGSVEEGVCDHPLDSDVDLVVTSFSHFRSLFFGNGGVHGLPRQMMPLDGDFSPGRRDLFYFDEAQGYSREEFGAFLRLIEFLFAEDLDVLVGTTTLHEAGIEELSYLETLYLPEANEEPNRSLRFVKTDSDLAGNLLSGKVNVSPDDGRVIIVAETPAEATAIHAAFKSADVAAHLYHSAQQFDDRQATYASLKARPSTSREIIIGDGPVIESSDLSGSRIIMSACSPELLLRRAGRCNRKSEWQNGEIIVVGDGSTVSGRKLPMDNLNAYASTLAEFANEDSFTNGFWVPFIG